MKAVPPLRSSIMNTDTTARTRRDPAESAASTPEALIRRLTGSGIAEVAAVLNDLTDRQLAALEAELTVNFAISLANAAQAGSAVVYDLFVIRPKPGQITAMVGLRDLLRAVRDEAVAREEFERLLV